MHPTLVPLVGHMPFPPQTPSQRATEEETVGTTALGARAPSASLSLPTSPDKQPSWTRAFHLPTVEEKQWHQSCSIQTNIVPINVSGRAAPHGAMQGKAWEAAPAPSQHWEEDAGCRQGYSPASDCQGVQGGGTGGWGCEPVSPQAQQGQSSGQQGHTAICHSQPSLLPSATLCVLSPATPPACLLFLPRCPAGWFCCHLGSRCAPCSQPVSLVCPSVGPSIHPCGAAAPSSMVLPGLRRHECHVLPTGQSLGPVAEQGAPSEGPRCLSALSLHDGGMCQDHTSPSPCPAVPYTHVPSVAQHHWPH